MQTPDIESNTKKLLDFVGKKFVAGELDNNSLVQLIELSGILLNLQTISDFAKENNISYNGAKTKPQVELFGVKFIINND